MACDLDRDRLSAYHDGQLDARSKADVEAHLAGCGDCRRELEEIRSAARLVQSLGRARAPEWLAERIRQEIARSAVPPRIVKFRRYIEAALACAAGLLLVMSVVHLAWGPAEHRRSPAPDIALSKPPETSSAKGFSDREARTERKVNEALLKDHADKADAGAELEEADEGKQFGQKNAPEPYEVPRPSAPSVKADKGGGGYAETEKASHCLLVFADDESAMRRLFESQMKNVGAGWSSNDLYFEADLTADEAQALIRKLQEGRATCREEPLVASAHDSLVKLQSECWSAYREREQQKERAKAADLKNAGAPESKTLGEQAQSLPAEAKKDAPGMTPARAAAQREKAEDEAIEADKAERGRAPDASEAQLRRQASAGKPVQRWRFYILPRHSEALKEIERLRKELQAPPGEKK